VGAGPDATTSGALEVRAEPPHAAGLAAAFRTAAACAAELAGGGLALVFAHTPGRRDPTPALRAAAGFQSAEAARIAAAAAEPLVSQALAADQPKEGQPEVSLGERARAGFWVAPLAVEERAHGALVVGLPAPLSPAARAGLTELVESLALRVDHATLGARLQEAEGVLAEKRRSEDERSDEILKLSEALFAQDIELLRSSEKLGKVEKLKNDFIEKMSRELRTPLNSIIEAIISVLAGENENLSEPARESLRHALDDGTAFLRTLQNILDLWRVKQGELPVECQEVNFREVIEEAIFSVQDTLGGKPVTIEKQLREPLPKIRTDLPKANQILFLLLDNAAKFTQEGQIEIAAEVTENRLRCAITDTGIGICADDMPYLFDEFYQVDETSSRVYQGAGLGLTLVRDLLTLLDGELHISSEIGRGTRVVFEIPVQVIG
jgi:signal transduction histidine kinase